MPLWKTMSQLQWLGAGFSLWSLGFNPRWHYMRFVVVKWDWSGLLSEFLQFYHANHHSAIAWYSSITAPWDVWWSWPGSILSHPGSSSLGLYLWPRTWLVSEFEVCFLSVWLCRIYHSLNVIDIGKRHVNTPYLLWYFIV
jgi:hypothetical protein